MRNLLEGKTQLAPHWPPTGESFRQCEVCSWFVLERVTTRRFVHVEGPRPLIMVASPSLVVDSVRAE